MDLAAETISPMIIGDMTDDEVDFIAAEPEETTRERSEERERNQGRWCVVMRMENQDW